MEMLAARMRADAADLDDVALGMTWQRTTYHVEHLHGCLDCRRSHGPEHFATAVLHLGILEEEIARRGDMIIRKHEAANRNRFANAMAPSKN